MSWNPGLSRDSYRKPGFVIKTLGFPNILPNLPSRGVWWGRILAYSSAMGLRSAICKFLLGLCLLFHPLIVWMNKFYRWEASSLWKALHNLGVCKRLQTVLQPRTEDWRLNILKIEGWEKIFNPGLWIEEVFLDLQSSTQGFGLKKLFLDLQSSIFNPNQNHIKSMTCDTAVTALLRRRLSFCDLFAKFMLHNKGHPNGHNASFICLCWIAGSTRSTSMLYLAPCTYIACICIGLKPMFPRACFLLRAPLNRSLRIYQRHVRSRPRKG